MQTLSKPPLSLAISAACLVVVACGGSGGSTTPNEPDTAARTLAATNTAQANAACTAVQPFYWELGDKTQRLASASVGSTSYTAATSMPIASASKWLYGAYVAERRAGVLTAEDIKYLNFQSGYTNFSVGGCDNADTVTSCLGHDGNGDYVAATDGKFYYNGAHMQKHASLPAPGMALGAMANGELAAEIRARLGTDIDLTYTQPQLAGGVKTTANDYAIFLRKLLNNQLKMTALLGSNKVCTNPTTCTDALRTPITANVDWHYSVGHWVEDDPAKGDGAFSSAGAFGFYPWIDASKTYYGIVARVDLVGGGNDSAICGALIRKAWMTGVQQ
jgi:hypothetical protein